MSKNPIIPYNRNLQHLARILRKNSTFAEILLWIEIKNRNLGVEFHRQVPIGNFIIDFYCHEILLAIEVDGASHDNKYDKDVARDKFLESFGIVVLRIEDFEVKKNMNNVLRIIEKEIERIREKHPPGPLQRGNY